MADAQMERPQQRYQPPGQTNYIRNAQADVPQARKASGSRPWKRDRVSRGRSDRRSSDGSVHNHSQSGPRSPTTNQNSYMIQQPDPQQPRPYEARGSPARDQLQYDRLGNLIDQRRSPYGLERPKSAAEDPNYPQNASMRSQNRRHRRPGSAAGLQNSASQGRNRFFSPQSQRSGMSSRHSRSLSQERVPQQRDHRPLTPSQLLNDAHGPSTAQQARTPNDPRPQGGQASRSPVRKPLVRPMQPTDAPNNRNSSRFSAGENFSDENHSPVRPAGQMSMNQSVPLRQQNHSMKQRFGNSITGSVTNTSLPSGKPTGTIRGPTKYAQGPLAFGSPRPQATGAGTRMQRPRY